MAMKTRPSLQNKISRVYSLLIQMSRWVKQGEISGCSTPYQQHQPGAGDCQFEVMRRLLKFEIYRHTMNLSRFASGESYTQLELQQAEAVLQAVRTSPLIRACDVPGDRAVQVIGDQPLDLWDCCPQVNNGSKPFYPSVYRAALEFYGLTAHLKPGAPYERTFSKNGDKFVQMPPEQAAAQGLPTWIQMNRVHTGVPTGKKASDAQIYSVQNFLLDFELPENPPLAHSIGLELAHYLSSLFKFQPGWVLPVEDTGAGCHIVIPVVEILVASVPEGERLLSAAATRLREEMIEPEFDRIKRRYGLTPIAPGGQYARLKLEASDISRIFSVPGTWRPGGLKRGDAEYLSAEGGGYVRRWLPPHNRPVAFPVRYESQYLSQLWQDTAQKLYEEQRRKQAELARARFGGVAIGATGAGAIALDSSASVRPQVTTMMTTTTTTDRERERELKYALTALEGEIESVKNAPRGSGNDALFTAALKLGQIVAAGTLDRFTVERELEAAATTGGRRSPIEAKATIKSGMEKGLREPRQLPIAN